MSDASTSYSRPPRRWPFYVSLFINGVLIAALAFGLWQMWHFREMMRSTGGPPGLWMPRQIERLLPEESRKKVEAIRTKHKDEFKPLFAASRTARDNLFKAFDAEPFDAAQMQAALTAVRQADSAIAEATGQVMLEIATSLTPEERKLVRDAAPKRGDRGKNLGGPDGPGGPPDNGDVPPPPP